LKMLSSAFMSKPAVSLENTGNARLHLSYRGLSSVKKEAGHTCFAKERGQQVRRRTVFRLPASVPEVATEDTVTSMSPVSSLIEKNLTPKEKLRLHLDAGRQLPSFPLSQQTISNRVMGCTTRTYLTVDLMSDGVVEFAGTSDSELTKGLIALLTEYLNGKSPETILEFDPSVFAHVIESPGIMTASRSNGFLNLIETLKRKTRMLLRQFPKFPSLLITSSQLIPQGVFAEAQAQFLEPDRRDAVDLGALLKEKRVGVVAHFYMDPEVQGMLSAASEIWPHIFVSDSLLMADTAVKMAEAGCKHIAVLGVDFMSENVRAILDKAGHGDVNVYRMSAQTIGCSLADAAASPSYLKFLSGALQSNDPALHVIYINTSLSTKAESQCIVPTITCTSSNVVQTILQASSQVENLRILYGPDTYMGQNIREMFQIFSEMTDEEIMTLHPMHNKQTIRSLLDRFEHFEDGTCIVHHLFGGDVCNTVKEAYGDAYITAHFEVPGEMFKLAMQAKKRGMGVVGSTANILNFISSTVKDQIANRTTDRLQFILGTESGMITSIVNTVKSILRENDSIGDLEVEIVFPVASSAITTESQNLDRPFELPDALKVVPGPASGEGCSAEGGCANCPYMKMNTLSALRHVLSGIQSDGSVRSWLSAYEPRSYSDTIQSAEGKSVSVQDVGCEPILQMRYFQKTGELSPELIHSIHNNSA